MQTRDVAAAILLFSLEVEDDWPPVGVESLPCMREGAGFRVFDAPLFVKDLSVGDVIEATIDDEGQVASWRHLVRSKHTTAWLLRMKRNAALAEALSELRQLGCNTVSSDSLGGFAVDIPESISLAQFDAVVDRLDSQEVAIAFPSLRHADEG